MAEAKNYVALALARAVTDAGKALIETGARLRNEADRHAYEDRMSKCDWPECPGYPKDVEKHEIESGPELHPQCKDAILLAERARREGWHTAPQEGRDES